MRNISGFVVALMFCAGSSAVAADFKVGDHVEGKWGNAWTPGTITVVQADKYRIHYTNYGDAFDAWLTPDAVRAPQPGASDTAEAKINEFNAASAKARAGGNQIAARSSNNPTRAYQVGNPVQINSGGVWYPAKVIAVNGDKYKIHYDNYSDTFDEWAGADRIKAAAEDTAKPSATDAPAADAAKTASSYSVGSSVEVNWNGQWWPAEIVSVAADQYRIHYTGFGSDQEETVTPDRIRTVAGASARAAGAAPDQQAADQKITPPAPGKGGLDGYYHQLVTRFGFHNMSYSTDEYFWFRPDGFAYFGVPPAGLEQFADFSVLQKLDPKNCGSYTATSDTLTYQRGADEPRSFKLKTEKNNTVLEFDGPSAIEVGKFASGQTYEATYSADAIAGDANTTVMSGSTIHFHKDGTFDGGRFGGIDAQGTEVAIWGSAQKPVRGTYKIGGNTMTITSDGKTVSFTAYPWPEKDESPPAHIGIGKEMYQLTK
ncbi:MAG: hypothetical protein JO353_05900 [Phycisphaerae bacterium]|nr:hypothetical protein [Phycisphaerae bacterium]